MRSFKIINFRLLASTAVPTTTSRDLFAGPSTGDDSRLRGQAAERRLVATAVEADYFKDIKDNISFLNLLRNLRGIMSEHIADEIYSNGFHVIDNFLEQATYQ